MKHMKSKMTLAGMGILSATIFFAACSKDDNPGLPPIDGYNNSNEVAAANLKAHWSFDNSSYKEDISGTDKGASFGSVGFTTGQIGGALHLDQGAVAYTPIANLNTANALPSYTVSMWLKVSNRKDAFSTFFGLNPADASDLWAAIEMSAETGWFTAADDTLVLKTNYGSYIAGAYNGQDNRPDPRGNPPVGVFKQAGKWCHFVARWNATTHELKVFGNGVSIGAYDNRGTTPEMILKPPMVPVFGSLPTKDLGFPSGMDRPSWAPMASADIDDVRVFNSAITDKEITALFNLGTAGR